MVVITELDARLLAGFAGAVEKIGGALPAIGRGALLFVEPRADNILMADDVGGIESLGQLLVDDFVADVEGRCG